MITFRLSTHSGVPLYLQIVQQVKQALQMGILQEGDQLPTVKEVISTVAINPNTVAKAYRELEKEGLVKGRTGLGTFMLKSRSGAESPIQPEITKDLEAWIAQARKAGLSAETMEALLRTKLSEGGEHATDNR